MLCYTSTIIEVSPIMANYGISAQELGLAFVLAAFLLISHYEETELSMCHVLDICHLKKQPWGQDGLRLGYKRHIGYHGDCQVNSGFHSNRVP